MWKVMYTNLNKILVNSCLYIKLVHCLCLALLSWRFRLCTGSLIHACNWYLGNLTCKKVTVAKKNFSCTKINRSSMNLKMQQQATGGAKWVKEGSPNENADRCWAAFQHLRIRQQHRPYLWWWYLDLIICVPDRFKCIYAFVQIIKSRAGWSPH